MPQTSGPDHARVAFDEHTFQADVERTSVTGAEVALATRRRYESEGIPVNELRAVKREGPEGTMLPKCLKVYLPPPDGRFGMVFGLVIHDSGARLRYLAFGTRHHPRDSHAPTVYQLAHLRLHDSTCPVLLVVGAAHPPRTTGTEARRARPWALCGHARTIPPEHPATPLLRPLSRAP